MGKDEDDFTCEASLEITVKRNRRQKSGLEVEQREDGYYYITKVPSAYKQRLEVGDRVLNINGIPHLTFRSQKHANDLIDSFRMEVIPKDSNKDDNPRNGRTGRNAAAGAATVAAAGIGAVASKARDPRGRNSRKLEDSDDSDDENDGRNGFHRRELSHTGDQDGHRGHDENYDDDCDDDSENGAEDERSYLEAERERAKVRANAARRNSEIDRPHVGKYNPNERFMITATKDSDDQDVGVSLIEHKSKFTSSIYVAAVHSHGPFFKTALDRGDKILAINGKKHPTQWKTAKDADKLINSKPKVTLFVMRPDPKNDKGYQWVIENT